jgi:hypothetical protein
MTPSIEGLSFEQGRADVDAMAAAGEPLSTIEEMIDHSGFGQDQKAALWLLAWSSQDAQDLHDNLEATLRLMAGARQ